MSARTTVGLLMTLVAAGALFGFLQAFPGAPVLILVSGFGAALTLAVARIHGHGWPRAALGALIAGAAAGGAERVVWYVLGAGYAVLRTPGPRAVSAALIVGLAGGLAFLDHPNRRVRDDG